MGKFERNDAKKSNSRGAGAGGKGKSQGSKGAGGKGQGSKGAGGKGKPSFQSRAPQKHKKVVVRFNPTQRHDYLTGFATRKKERRAFGLAMQKVKDREEKLEERKDQREAQLERITDIESNKKALRQGLTGESAYDDDDDDDGGGKALNEQQHTEQELTTFQDDQTTHQFGGLVSVTTTFGIPSDDDDDDDKKGFFDRKKHSEGHVDEAQQRAGDVHKFVTVVKGTMGQKKSKANGGGRNGPKKGSHGAATMKGMGNATTLKMAQKTLSKFKTRGGGEGMGGNGVRVKGKKGKGRK